MDAAKRRITLTNKELKMNKPVTDKTLKDISDLQDDNGLKEIQMSILDGSIWLGPGFGGRQAMHLLDTGACYLPVGCTMDAYGRMVPGRDQVVPGTKGSLENSYKFWSDEDNWEHTLSDLGAEFDLSEDTLRDLSVRIVDELVREGAIKDCIDTNDGAEFDAQDIIVRVLKENYLGEA